MNPVDKTKKGKVKFSMRVDPDCREDELDFAAQLGLDCVYCWVRDDQTDLRSLEKIRGKIESHSLAWATTANYRLGKCPEIQLNLPGRDRMIEEYIGFIGNLGRAGVGTTTFTWEPTYTYFWNLEGTHTTRGALTRRVDAADVSSRPPLFQRDYSEEELWDNLKFFLDAVLPAAEASNVRLALHPNDPPIPRAGGVPFLIRSAAAFEKALAVRPSGRLGIEFCSGCWLEGGRDFGDITADFERFAAAGKVFVVHFRNVSGPLPVFDETFLDNGAYPMIDFARAIARSGYDGTVILDHYPAMAESFGRGSSLAYNMGYMKALFERAYDELEE